MLCVYVCHILRGSSVIVFLSNCSLLVCCVRLCLTPLSPGCFLLAGRLLWETAPVHWSTSLRSHPPAATLLSLLLKTTLLSFASSQKNTTKLVQLKAELTGVYLTVNASYCVDIMSSLMLDAGGIRSKCYSGGCAKHGPLQHCWAAGRRGVPLDKGATTYPQL